MAALARSVAFKGKQTAKHLLRLISEKERKLNWTRKQMASGLFLYTPGGRRQCTSQVLAPNHNGKRAFGKPLPRCYFGKMRITDKKVLCTEEMCRGL